MKTDQELRAAGFTVSGAKRYRDKTNIYCSELFNRAVALGDVHKAPDASREVTHEHVHSAALALALQPLRKPDKVQIWCQAGEYACAAAAGVGGGKLEHVWGFLLFSLSLALGIILFIVRTLRGKSQ